MPVPHQTEEMALDTMRYRTGETVQRSGDFRNRQCKLCKGARENNKESKYICKEKGSNQGIKTAR